MKVGNLKIDENTVVHCPTEELAKQVLNIAHGLGYKWRSGESLSDCANWERCKDYTCYSLNEVSYAYIDHYKKLGYIIISAEEFIALHEPKKEDTMTNPVNKMKSLSAFKPNDNVETYIDGTDNALLEKDRLKDEYSERIHKSDSKPEYVDNKVEHGTLNVGPVNGFNESELRAPASLIISANFQPKIKFAGLDVEFNSPEEIGKFIEEKLDSIEELKQDISIKSDQIHFLSTENIRLEAELEMAKNQLKVEKPINSYTSDDKNEVDDIIQAYKKITGLNIQKIKQ